ncbi:MAG: hypothetical protein HY329_15665 [Chloroflexi bacterium]|nr:hypothetical protein [Chloroflexota bacterium]
MAEVTLESLSARLEQVERANCRWRRAGLGAIVIAALSVVGGGFHAVQVEAQAAQYSASKYNVVDDNNKGRGTLNVSPEGDLGLALFGPDGKPGETIPTGMFVGKDGTTALFLTDPKGNLRITAGTSGDGSAGLAILDDKLNSRLVLEITKDNDAKLSIKDSGGQTVWSAP